MTPKVRSWRDQFIWTSFFCSFFLFSNHRRSFEVFNLMFFQTEKCFFLIQFRFIWYFYGKLCKNPVWFKIVSVHHVFVVLAGKTQFWMSHSCYYALFRNNVQLKLALTKLFQIEMERSLDEEVFFCCLSLFNKNYEYEGIFFLVKWLERMNKMGIQLNSLPFSSFSWLVTLIEREWDEEEKSVFVCVCRRPISLLSWPLIAFSG